MGVLVQDGSHTMEPMEYLHYSFLEALGSRGTGQIAFYQTAWEALLSWCHGNQGMHICSLLSDCWETRPVGLSQRTRKAEDTLGRAAQTTVIALHHCHRETGVSSHPLLSTDGIPEREQAAPFYSESMQLPHRNR